MTLWNITRREEGKDARFMEELYRDFKRLMVSTARKSADGAAGGKYIVGDTGTELALRFGCEPDSIGRKLTRAGRRTLKRLAERNRYG